MAAARQHAVPFRVRVRGVGAGTPGPKLGNKSPAGAGIGTRASVFDLASEVRFMHWTTGYFVPVQNQAVLIVSVTFPARHK